MSRLGFSLPETFSFSTIIPVRITDINYGNHVGNDAVLSIIHEARMQYLQHHGYTELQFEGIGMIMRDVAIDFKNELFYGDQVKVSVNAGDFSRAGFDLFYKLEKQIDDKLILVASSRTGMVCYDYEKKKVVALPEKAQVKLSSAG